MSVSIQSRYGANSPQTVFDYGKQYDEIFELSGSDSSQNEHDDRLSYINSCLDDHFQGLFSKLKLVTKVTKEQEIFDDKLRKKLEAVRKEIYHTKFFIADFFKNLDEIAIEQVYDELELPF